MRDLIVRLGRGRARLSRRLAGPGERGAIGVLVAVLVAGGVLFGIGALVVDTGQLYQNRAELQSGADAAALAVARSCAVNTANCTQTFAAPIAAQYASHNASILTGGAAAANPVCGFGSLGGCPASTSAIYDCPTTPPAGTKYVDVHTATKLSNGSTLLPPVFSRTLAGNGNYQGSTVKACARAEWGAPSTATLIGVTISACSWDADTNQGASFAPAPPYPPNPLPAASFDQVLQLHGTNTSGSGCPTEPAGADAPGNFGWTTDLNGNCTVTVSGNSFGGSTGNSVSKDCQTVLSNAQSTKTVIYIPVYVSLSGTGNNVTYMLKGFAAFVVTGYHLPSFTAKDWLNPANDCKGSSFCLNGYFTQGLIPITDVTGGLGGGPNLGADIIKLAG